MNHQLPPTEASVVVGVTRHRASFTFPRALNRFDSSAVWQFGSRGQVVQAVRCDQLRSKEWGQHALFMFPFTFRRRQASVSVLPIYL